MLKKGIYGNKKGFIVLAVVVVLLLAVVTFSIGSLFIPQIKLKVRSTTVQVIGELTNTKAEILDTLLMEMERNVGNLAEGLEETGNAAMALALLENFEENYQPAELFVLDKEGNCLYGMEDFLAVEKVPPEFFKKVEKEAVAMSDAIIGVDGRRRVLVGTVLPGKGLVCASVSANILQAACGKTTYRGEGYSYILKQDGEIMIPPMNFSYEQTYNNIRLLLDDGKNDPNTLDAFMEALKEGKDGSVIFHFNGKNQILCFEALKAGNNWYFATVVPLEAVEQDGAQIIRMAMFMAAIIMVLVIAVLTVSTGFYITAQRRKEKNNRFLRDIYQAISENTDTVIFIMDCKKSHLDYVFENSGSLLGVSAGEFFENEKKEVPQSTFLKELQGLLQEQQPQKKELRRLHTFNDRLNRDMWLKVLICPFYLGEDKKCIYAVTDVTQEYEDREKITAAVLAAEQASAAKSGFLSNMSHDMRTPMNGIVGMTAIAKKSIDDRDKVLDCLNKIDLSSKHLLSLINDVLDMSKIESGKLALSNEAFQLSVLLEELEVMLRPQCEAKQQSLTFMVHIVHNELIGDVTRLSQIFMNLLSNAVKFTSEGGSILLEAKEMPQRHSNFAAYRFNVTDNGIGISHEFQKLIFKPFERAKNQEVQKTEGTGLGMAITKNLISTMGGQIHLTSEPGKGTAFTIDLELPLQKTEAWEPQPEKIEMSGEGLLTGRHILLVEDNALNQEIAAELLSGFGITVDTADNGEEALEKFQCSCEGYYDAILMDIQMPVMNGYEAARAIRSSMHPQAGRIPIVAMTANVFAEDIAAAKEAGMNDHIPKPVDLQLLYQALKNCIENESL